MITNQHREELRWSPLLQLLVLKNEVGERVRNSNWRLQWIWLMK